MKIIPELTGQVVGGFICNGYNGVKGHVWGGEGGTTIMKNILGFTGQVVGGVHM